MSDRKRLLNDLRVLDLRAELEKRNIDKSGVRGVLKQRLSKYIQEEEGQDPATYIFDQPGGGSEPKSSPTKRARRSEIAVEAETAEETPVMEDMVVQDDAGEDEEQEEGEQEAVPEVDTEVPQTESEPELAGAGRKRDMLDNSDASQPKKPCLQEDEDQKHENNTDVDDSINLDLGEDEMLNEETDSTSKAKMDEASEEATETAGKDTTAGNDSAAAGDQQVNEDDAAAISNDGENDEKDKGDKNKDGDGEKRDTKDDSKEGGARNLWVSGLSGDTRAKDLKQLCSKHGKVIGAKVVTNAKTPGSRCYGYVTMASAQDAENCMKNLHRSKLHGRMIYVEKAKSESESAVRRQPSRPDRRRSTDRKDASKEEENKDGANCDKGKKEGEGGENQKSDSRTREKSNRPDKDRPIRSTRSRERRRSPPRDTLSFNKIWKERDVARSRERSRAMREEDRRRRVAEEALRERERRQRQERQRLAEEKEKLRAEREKIEREKNALLRLERERHRLEREKLELERLELKRAQLRLEEERRKRTYDNAYRKPAPRSPLPEPAYDRERHKRTPPPSMSSSRAGQFEAPPPPRFDMAAGYDRGADKRERVFKREYPRHAASGNMKYPSNGNSNDDARQAMPPGNRPKEPGRSYESRDARPYLPSPPVKPEPRPWSGTNRYQDAAPGSKGAGGSEAWSGGVARYGSGGGGGGGVAAAQESRYQPAYQPPPPGCAYPERYAPPAREYRKY